MARQLRGIEKGIRLFGTNADTGVSYLFGTGAPGGDAGDQDNANVGSIYNEDGGGKIYHKITAGSGADKWAQLPSFDDLNSISFRSKAIALTDDNITSGAARDLVASPLSDDEAPLLVAADFTVGDLVIADASGTPRLMEVTAVAAPNVTFTDSASPLSTNDNFVIKYHLPDSDGTQENQSFVHYNGSSVIKLGDIDWNFATGINLSSGYVTIVGSVAANDTVEVAIAKLDKRTLDLITLTGVAANAIDLGTFTGNIIPDNVAIKPALQSLETAINSLEFQSQLTGVTTVQTLDSVLVDDVLACEWELHSREDANPSKIQVKKIFATHDGHSGADAVNVDDSVDGVLKIGSNFNNEANVILTGSGSAQKMELQVQSSTAGVTFSVRRNTINA